jgi:hypothetical protein
MKQAIADLWNIFVKAIKNLDKPIEKYAAGMGILILVWLVLFSFASLFVHGIVDVVEIIGTTITETVTGEVPKV